MSTLNTVSRSLVFLVALSAAAVAAEGDRAGARPSDSARSDILEHFVGKWEGQGRFVGSDGYTTTEAGESGGRFILGGKFVERAWINDGGGGLKIIGFDERAASYFSWSVSTAGKIHRQTGQWDPKARMMTWSGTVHGHSFVSEMILGSDRLSERVRLTDKKGGVLMSGTFEERRVSRTADPKFFERAIGAGSASHVPELKPLQVFAGPWRETLVVDVPGREKIRGAGAYAARWGLGGVAQLWRGSRETSLGSEEYFWVFTFTEKEREHRAMWLSSQGAVVEYIGGKTPDSDVWRWQADGLRAGVQQTISFDATTPSRIESNMEMKQGATGTGITLRSTATRDRSPGN